MRILITGGCGFLGHHLVEHFLKTTDADIVVLDKLSYASSGYDRLRDINAYDDKRVRKLGCDLSNEIPLGVRQEVGEIDYVIHAAAETHVDNSITNPLPFYQSNVLGTHHLLWWLKEARSARLKRIFLVSTDEVYGPAAWDHPGNVETDMFRPANPYAAAKAGGESIGMAYANTYGLPITIVNTMNLYGERQHPEKFIPLVIRRALDGTNVQIHADPTKTRSGTRFYIHCRNYASALAWLIERDGRKGVDHVPPSSVTTKEDIMRWHAENPPPNGCVTYTPALPLKVHVSGEREISNEQLALMIADFVGRPLNYELVDFHSSRPGHDLRYALDDAMIRDMGWKQPLDTAQSLERTVRWFLEPKNSRWLYLDKK